MGLPEMCTVGGKGHTHGSSSSLIQVHAHVMTVHEDGPGLSAVLLITTQTRLWRAKYRDQDDLR
jgi:hypothetical protein